MFHSPITVIQDTHTKVSCTASSKLTCFRYIQGYPGYSRPDVASINVAIISADVKMGTGYMILFPGKR